MTHDEKIEVKNEPIQEDVNPWLVDSIQAFTYLKCPECLYDTKKEDNFQEHALESHPLSIVFFENNRIFFKEEKLEISVEDVQKQVIKEPQNVAEFCEIVEASDYDLNYENIEYLDHIIEGEQNRLDLVFALPFSYHHFPEKRSEKFC